MKLSQTHASNTSRVIVYGAPKTGKSQLAGALAEHFNLIWVDLENGYETLYKLPVEWQERVELIRLPDTRDFPIGIETCLKIIKGKSEICEEHGKVSCMLCKKDNAATTVVDVKAMTPKDIIVFDSITQLTNSAIAHITKNKAVDYKLDWDDWNHLGVLLDTFFSYVEQANFNVVCISHEIEAETEGSKKTLVPVAGTRNFSRNVAKYFGHVVYCERTMNKHRFSSSTTDASNILSGSRTDVDVRKQETPSLLPIFKPELYTSSKVKAPAEVEESKDDIVEATVQAAATEKTVPKPKGDNAAQDVLARLRNKK